MADGHPALVLIGAPGAGKTRIGKRVAKLLHLPFIDTDKRIVAAHGAIAEIFSAHGESHFRSLEREAVIVALREHAVVALGGGAVLNADTQEDLQPLRVAQVRVTPEAMEKRGLGTKRPLIKGIESWKDLVAVRAPIYDRLADRTFDTSSVPAERIAAEIAAWVKEELK